MKIICPSCHHSAEAPDSVKGARVRCPLCATEFTAQETHAFTVLTPETPPEAKPHYTQRMAPYGTALKKCFTGFSFSGRASRSDYWFAMTLLVPITSLTGILGGISIVLQSAIGIIFFACLSIPFSYLGYTLAARRLNDIGFPGKIAIFGFVVYLTCAFLVLLSSLNVALDLFNSSQLFTIEITELLLNSLVLIPLSIFFFVCSLISSKHCVTQQGPIPYCDEN